MKQKDKVKYDITNKLHKLLADCSLVQFKIENTSKTMYNYNDYMGISSIDANSDSLVYTANLAQTSIRTRGLMQYSETLFSLLRENHDFNAILCMQQTDLVDSKKELTEIANLINANTGRKLVTCKLIKNEQKPLTTYCLVLSTSSHPFVVYLPCANRHQIAHPLRLYEWTTSNHRNVIYYDKDFKFKPVFLNMAQTQKDDYFKQVFNVNDPQGKLSAKDLQIVKEFYQELCKRITNISNDDLLKLANDNYYHDVTNIMLMQDISLNKLLLFLVYLTCENGTYDRDQSKILNDLNKMPNVINYLASYL